MRMLAGSLVCTVLLAGAIVSHAMGEEQNIGKQDIMDDESDLDLSLEDIMNIEVSIASKSKEKVSDAPGVISVITQDELKRFGSTSLGDVLKQVPSFLGGTITITERSVIAPRGDMIMNAPSSHVLLLINGRPVRETLEGGIKSEMYESFPVTVIDHIEVIRGPGSVLYGSQAFSAVINVVTKSPENNTVSLSGALGEGMANNVMLDLQYKLGNFGIVAAGRYADKGLWKTPYETFGTQPHTYDIEIPNYGPGFFGEVSYRDDRFLNFTYSASYCEWTNQYYVPDLQAFLDMVPGLPNYITDKETWRKIFNNVGYSLKLSEKYSLNADFTYTDNYMRTPDNKRESYEMIGEVTNFFTPIDHFNILLGGVYGVMAGSEINPQTDEIYNEDNKQNTFSGYAQIDYRYEWFKIIGGVQVNKVAEFDADINPRAGLILYPLENINIKALYSTAYRAPLLNELYLNHPFIKGKVNAQLNPDYTGDKTYEPVLNPEKVRTFDLGINYAGENVQFGINGFHSKMKDLIKARSTDQYLSSTYDNLDEITIFGLESEGKYYLTKEVLVIGSILFQQSKNDNTKETDVSPLPNFSAKGGLSYQTEWGLTVSGFNTFQEAFNSKYRSTQNKPTNYFHLANVHCSYDFSKLLMMSKVKALSLVVNVDNLLDEEIWLPAWGMNPGSTIPYIEGRTIYGGFKISF